MEQVTHTAESGPEMAKHLRKLGTAIASGHGWRKGTKIPKVIANFVLTAGGLGDYVCHTPAFEWIATTHPQVKGRIFCAEPYLSVLKYIMGKYPHWAVHHPKESKGMIKKGEMLLSPAQYTKYINATGSHLMDLGFMYYGLIDGPPPEFNRMPDLSTYRSGKTWEGLDVPYAVITPYSTTDTRRMKGKYLNELSNYLKSKNILPVYLGKKVFAKSEEMATVDPRYKGDCDPEFDPSLGLDLCEKTTLLEATEIMGKAKMVIGLDNGLLHFAGCTEVPIIFGHNIASVDHRVIRRPVGETINITISEKHLPCVGCQSRLRFLPTHDFKRCLYGDAACLDMLFADNCHTWKRAIDHMLELDLSNPTTEQ